MSKTHPTRHLLLMVGLGVAAAAALLLWAGHHAPAMLAAAKGTTAAASPALQGNVTANWTSTTPYTTTVNRDGKYWSIPEHGVVISFPVGALDSSSGAVFTFTPLTSHAEPPTALSTYFFDLRGVYSLTGKPASMDYDYYITLEYDPSELGGAKENSLQFYFYHVNSWDKQTTAIDTDANVVTCTTWRTGLFALAGYSEQIFLPLVLREN